jgi:hypothetical protein
MRVSTLTASWRLVPVADVYANMHAYGDVKTVQDLYRPATFGPSRSFRCECGKWAGEDAVDRLCDKCGVLVSDDADATRRQRSAKISLATFCRHPLATDEAVIDCFAVAPIAFRVDARGEPNALGRKYERLVEVNEATRQRLPKKGTGEFFAALPHDTAELQSALDDVVGGDVDWPAEGPAIVAGDSLLALLLREIVTLGPSADVLARSCGIAIQVTATL